MTTSLNREPDLPPALLKPNPLAWLALFGPGAIIASLTIGTGGLCPGCGAALPARAVLCVGCGFDLRKGARLSTEDDAHPAGAGSVARVGAVTAVAAASRVGVPGAAAPVSGVIDLDRLDDGIAALAATHGLTAYRLTAYLTVLR